jgi:hypothetical protein
MKFQRKTSYYQGVVYEWNLPSGWSCPHAKECLVKVHRDTGKFDDRSDDYKCYSAVAERFPGVRDSRWRNFDYVRKGHVPILPNKATAIRIHASGDFFSQAYFDMWLNLCAEHPHREFWAYTKSLTYWVARLKVIPKNLVLTASIGGRHDHLIQQHDLKHVEVIKDVSQANGRPIDTCDDQARRPGVNFCLLDNFA